MEEFTCGFDKTVPLNCSKKIDKPFCGCKPGYVRDKCGFCVEEKDCVKECYVKEPIWCPGGNETLYGCYDDSVDRMCPHLRKKRNVCSLTSSSSSSSTSSSSSSSNNLVIFQKCGCLPHFFRNDCGKCVALEDCKNECTIMPYDPCSDPNARRGNENEIITCKEFLSGKKKKVNPNEVVKENVCVCNDGLVLDDCGRCITQQQCKSKVPCRCSCPCNNKKHEDWRCFTGCYERTCEYLDERYFRRCSLSCRYGCDCAVNHWRYTDPEKSNQTTREKECIPTEECPQSWPEFYQNE